MTFWNGLVTLRLVPGGRGLGLGDSRAGQLSPGEIPEDGRWAPSLSLCPPSESFGTLPWLVSSVSSS